MPLNIIIIPSKRHIYSVHYGVSLAQYSAIVCFVMVYALYIHSYDSAKD